MIEAERHRIIRMLVDERSIVSVSDLVDILAASEATVRRDISTLSQRGEVIRIRGGVQSVRPPRNEVHLVGLPFKVSQGVAVAEKRAIAQRLAGGNQRPDICKDSGNPVLAPIFMNV